LFYNWSASGPGQRGPIGKPKRYSFSKRARENGTKDLKSRKVRRIGCLHLDLEREAKKQFLQNKSLLPKSIEKSKNLRIVGTGGTDRRR